MTPYCLFGSAVCSLASSRSRSARRSALVVRFGPLFGPFWSMSRCIVPFPTPSAFAACRWLIPASISFVAVSRRAATVSRNFSGVVWPPSTPQSTRSRTSVKSLPAILVKTSLLCFLFTAVSLSTG